MTTYTGRSLFRITFSLLLLVGVTPGLVQAEGPPAADTIGGCSWSSPAVYPISILDAPAVVVGSNLYVFGGVSSVIIATSNRFDGTAWTPIAPLPAAVEFPAAVTDGTNIFILGGANTAGTPTTTLTRYNVVANTYTPLAPFTTGTWNHAAIFLGGKIYKFAGTGPATNSTNVMEIYDVATNTWSLGPVYPLSTSFVGAWTQAGFIYAAGGITAPGSVVTLKTFRYDPVANAWDDVSIADLPLTRWGAAATAYTVGPGTDGVLVGGYVNGALTANISNTAIAWDLPSNTWNTLPNAVAERSRMTGAFLGGAFHVIGGRSIASPAFVGTNNNQRLLCTTPVELLNFLVE